jgi:hypothetical protein
MAVSHGIILTHLGCLNTGRVFTSLTTRAPGVVLASVRGPGETILEHRTRNSLGTPAGSCSTLRGAYSRRQLPRAACRG